MSVGPYEYALLKGAMFGDDTYEVYRADNKDQALEFLNDITVGGQQYYVVVETRFEVVGKDRRGIYSPSESWRGDNWVSERWRDLDQEARRRRWLHWPGPFEEPYERWEKAHPSLAKIVGSITQGQVRSIGDAILYLLLLGALIGCGMLAVKWLPSMVDSLAGH